MSRSKIRRQESASFSPEPHHTSPDLLNVEDLFDLKSFLSSRTVQLPEFVKKEKKSPALKKFLPLQHHSSTSSPPFPGKSPPCAAAFLATAETKESRAPLLTRCNGCTLLPLSSPSEPLTVARHWPRLSQCESRHYTARGVTRRGAEIVAVC